MRVLYRILVLVLRVVSCPMHGPRAAHAWAAHRPCTACPFVMKNLRILVQLYKCTYTTAYKNDEKYFGYFPFSLFYKKKRHLLLYFARRWRAEFCTTSAGLSAKELGLARSCCHGESALLSSPSCHGEFDAHCARDRCDGAAVSPNPSFWERACGPQALLDGIKVAQTE